MEFTGFHQNNNQQTWIQHIEFPRCPPSVLRIPPTSDVPLAILWFPRCPLCVPWILTTSPWYYSLSCVVVVVVVGITESQGRRRGSARDAGGTSWESATPRPFPETFPSELWTAAFAHDLCRFSPILSPPFSLCHFSVSPYLSFFCFDVTFPLSEPCLSNSSLWSRFPFIAKTGFRFWCFFVYFFEVVFEHLLEAVLVASWIVFGPHVGPMLGAFSSFFRS